jgi:hypothetical protein
MPTQTHSGFQRMIWNFRERVVSDDFNRALQFLARQEAERLRLAHASIASEEEAGGKTVPASALASPTTAILFEGVRPRPEIGTTNLFVEPGAGLFVAPHADPHPADSPARLVLDPGVQTAGQLVLTAGGGGTRIDVVECQVTDAVTEADNRDIFDPSTGLFSPVLVNKVARGSLTWRIRLGTPGAGVPGTASGWLPVAVCSVPAIAVTWNDVTVWDVRPLLSDLARPPHRVAAQWNPIRRQHLSVIDEGGGVWRARGIVEAELFGWRLGGNLAPTNSGATGIRLDAAATPNVQEPGFAAVASRPWYLYLAQPFGLPRWCLLSPSSTGVREPQAPRGVPIFTQRAPVGLSGTPSAALALPTATGLGGTTSAALAVMAGAFGAGSTFCGTVTGGDAMTRVLTPGIALAPSGGAGTAAVTYALTSTEIPAHASAVRLRLTTVITVAAGDYTISRIMLLRDAPAGNAIAEERLLGSIASPGAVTDQFEIELPLPPRLPTGTFSTLELAFTIALGGGAPAWASQTATIVGWKIG